MDVGDVAYDVGGFGGGPTTNLAARVALPATTQVWWDAQAHALIALSIKRTITPPIHSARSTNHAYNILVNLYATQWD